MTQPRIEFWFDFASTYSYLSAMRLDTLARAARIEVTWRPFLLGPIFAAQGWTSSPFNLYPAKGAYMWRDMARLCEQRGLPFAKPAPFPQNGVLAARTAQLALETPQGAAFCQAVYGAQFAKGHDIADPDTICACLDQSGLPRDLINAALSDDNKARLRASTEEAMARGIFGAPSFATGLELFWGDDRLEQALDWATRHA